MLRPWRRRPTQSCSTTTACCSTPSRSGPVPSRTSSRAAGPSSPPPTSASWSAPRRQVAGAVLERRLGEPGRAAELIEELNELVVAELEHGVEAMVGARELLHAPARAGDAARPRLQLAARLRAPLAGDRRLRGPLRRRRSAPTKPRRRSRRPTPTWRPAGGSASRPARPSSPSRTRRPGSPPPAPPA